MLLGFFYLLVFVGLAATIVSLILGLLTMGAGGEFNNKYGNMFMRFRLYSQLGAVIGVVGVFWQTGAFGG